jgi:hypothetical protein
MIVLTSAVLEGMLATIFAVDQKYIVPKQGNWWNPQDMTPTPTKPMTWCAYDLGDETPLDLPHYVQDSQSPPQNWSVQHKVAELTLQFVGTDGKKLASSVGHWINNAVAQAQFALVDGKICGGSGRVRSSDFYQDGENTVKAYNTSLRIIYASEIETDQDILMGATFGGVVTAS